MHALIVRRCFVVTPLDMSAIEVTNIPTGVWNVGMTVGVKCESGGL